MSETQEAVQCFGLLRGESTISPRPASEAVVGLASAAGATDAIARVASASVKIVVGSVIRASSDAGIGALNEILS